MSTTELARRNRRTFLTHASAIGVVAMFGLDRSARAEPPPEITKIRLVHAPAVCLAPQYLAEELLHMEGFSQVDYVTMPAGTTLVAGLGAGLADLGTLDAPSLVPGVDSGQNLAVLAGVHAGCWELFGNEATRSVRDLKGKAVAINGIGIGDHIFISSMAAYVGLKPRTDINWVTAQGFNAPMQLFIDGKVDAFLGFPPQPQEVRRRKIGHVIVDTAKDRPWSQYFCCMVAAHKDFVHAHPVATKRTLRAILKAADICAQDPERAVRYMVAKGYEPRYEAGLELLKSLPYDRWRQSDPTDTLRFHALRLHEAGMIKSDPKQIIAQGTDWRFLNELKRELKA